MATQGEVDVTCTAIAARGERPTVDRVRTALGGGSPNALTPMVRAWKDAQRAVPPVGEVRPTAPATEQAVLPLQVQAVVDTVLSTLRTVSTSLDGLAPAFAEFLAGMAEVERRRTRLEIEGIEAGAAARVADAMAVADDERTNTDLIRQEVAEKEAELASGRAAQAQFEADVTRLTSELAQERAVYSTAVEAAARAREDAAAEAERLAAEVASAQVREAAATEAASAAKMTGAAALAQAEEARAEAERLRGQLAEATAKTEAARDELATLRTQVAVAEKGERAEAQRAARAEAEVERLRDASRPQVPAVAAAA